MGAELNSCGLEKHAGMPPSRFRRPAATQVGQGGDGLGDSIGCRNVARQRSCIGRRKLVEPPRNKGQCQRHCIHGT